MLIGKLLRLATMGKMLSRHADGMGAALTLLRAYLSTLSSTTSTTEAACALRLAGRTFLIRLRLSDIFVLEEVLLQHQYDLQSSLGTAPLIVDAGANIGIAALWFLASHPDASVHAFEPDPHNCRLLRTNLGHLPRTVVSEAALAASSGTATLHLAPHGAMHSLAGGPDATSGTRQVPCLALADYLAAHHIEHVDLLKLDVEGSELDVLRGLGDRLETVDVIVGELHEAMVDPSEFYGFLERRGFRRLRTMAGDPSDRVQIFEVARWGDRRPTGGPLAS